MKRERKEMESQFHEILGISEPMLTFYYKLTFIKGLDCFLAHMIHEGSHLLVRI